MNWSKEKLIEKIIKEAFTLSEKQAFYVAGVMDGIISKHEMEVTKNKSKNETLQTTI